MKIRITKEEIVDATPEFLARLFCELDGDEQASFFNKVASIAITEWKRESPTEWIFNAWDTQAYNISTNLDDNGREIISLLSAHLSK